MRTVQVKVAGAVVDLGRVQRPGAGMVQRRVSARSIADSTAITVPARSFASAIAAIWKSSGSTPGGTGQGPGKVVG